VFYDAYGVPVSGSGTWVFSLCSSSGFDSVMALYQSPFDPGLACQNIVAYEDDTCGDQASITANLNSGLYVLVVTSFSNGATGPYALDVTGPPSEVFRCIVRPTPTATVTPTLGPATATATASNTPTDTATATVLPTVAASPTQTRTSTPGPSPTPSATPVATATPAASRTPGTTVVGTVRLQTRSLHVGTQILLDGVPVVSTGLDGGFAILGHPPGTYLITARRPGNLDMQTTVSILPFVVVNMGEALLAGGDVNDDGAVTFDDLLDALAAFGTCIGDPGYNPLADQNESGCVDQVDLDIINDNFGRVEPTSWVPVP